MKNKIFGGLSIALVVLAIIFYFLPPKVNPAPPPITFTEPPAAPLPQQYADEIIIDEPKPEDLVTNPVKVRGKARGFWFFEASMPVSILDADKKQIGVAALQARGEWMTTDFVPFEGTVTFTKPASDTGFILFQNDDPSALPEHSKSFLVPVRFR